MTRTSQDFAKFLESLKVKNEGPELCNGVSLKCPVDALPLVLSKMDIDFREGYYLRRIRHDQLNAKPETLAEDVKAFMRAALHVATEAAEHPNNEGKQEPYEQFRNLCEPGGK